MDEFVGRHAERARFAELLTSPSAAAVLVHGPGGSGKTALLNAFATDARAHEVQVLALEATSTRSVPVDPGRRILFLLDDCEPGFAAVHRLRAEWPSGLPDDALVVIAARTPPSRRLQAGLGWPVMTDVFALSDFGDAEAAAFVAAAGVPVELEERVLRFGQRCPLALRVLSDLAVHAPDQLPVRSIEENMGLVGQLLDEIVGPVPTGRHRRTLQVCAHVRFTTEDLLGSALAGDVQELFEWLRHRPYVTQASRGLTPSPIVRSIVEADLRWRDRAMFRALDGCLMRALMAQTERPARDLQAAFRAAVDALYLRPEHSPTLLGLTDPADWAFFDTATFARYDPSLRVELEATAPARLWPWICERVEATPTSSAVFRDGSGTLVAFGNRTKYTPESIATAREEAAIALHTHADTYGRARDGETLAITRVEPFRPDLEPHAAIYAIAWLALAAQYELTSTWEGVIVPAYPAWREALAYFDFHPVAELSGGRKLYAHDWRRLDVRGVFRMFVEQPRGSIGREPANLARHAFLSEAEFEQAIRRAMRDLAFDSRLADNPLIESRIVRSAEPGLSPERRLRKLIREEAGALREEHPQLFRILDSTYLRPSATQEQIAERMGLAFTTYRRRRNRAVSRVAAALWAKEIGNRRD